jgi:hypothetical protein
MIGYGETASGISVSKATMNEGSIGKSSVINESDESLTLEYNQCVYDYDKSTQKKSRVSCSPSSIVIKPGSYADFDLSPDSVVSPGVTRFHSIYIKKISSEMRTSYFISDPLDSDSYYQYKTTYHKGVHRVAFNCELAPSKDVKLYVADTGVLCR